MNQLADQVYKKFAQKLGPDQIATPKALHIIDHYLVKFLAKYSSDQNGQLTPKIIHKNSKRQVRAQGSIIEIGSGIGTITELLKTRILQNTKDFKLICYETNEWCINQLQINIQSNYILCRYISEILNAVPKNDPVFLVIDEYITYDQTQELLNKLAIKFVVIEGHRFRQRKVVSRLLLKKAYTTKFYGNSFNSVKGAVVFKVIKQPFRFLSFFNYFRLNLQANIYVRKVLQFCGIRKKFLLNKFYKS
jgi:16S rRNA A1518/A1519 N6-dimethyltransferase RsmA/KsgA/DIM1 with predicted DNA glycosylase/AP lyase activity